MKNRLMNLLLLFCFGLSWAGAMATPSYRLQLISEQPGPRVQALKGQLSFTIQIDRKLDSGHSLWIRMDGFDLQPVNAGRITLADVPRGEHQFDLAVYEAQNPSPLVVTRPITLDVRRLTPHRSR